MLHELDQPILVEVIEKSSDIGIQNVVHLLLQERVRQRIQCLMLAASRAKPIRKAEKILFIDLSRREYDCSPGGSDMRVRLAVTLLVLTASFAFGQNQSREEFCNAASATAVDPDTGVILQKVTLSGMWGSNDARVYLPNKEIADGAVVLSHSEIHTDKGTLVDLLPLALTLAHAGAAVIVPSRSLLWPPTERSPYREGAVEICAEHWLIEHTKVLNNGEPTVNDENIVVRHGYAYIGPRLCDPAVPSDCDLETPFVSEDC